MRDSFDSVRGNRLNNKAGVLDLKNRPYYVISLVFGIAFVIFLICIVVFRKFDMCLSDSEFGYSLYFFTILAFFGLLSGIYDYTLNKKASVIIPIIICLVSFIVACLFSVYISRIGFSG